MSERDENLNTRSDNAPWSHPAQAPIAVLQDQCDVRSQRRSGPGGQHRNKTNSGIFLVHRPTGVLAEATERRSALENLKVALSRLRINLALEFRRGDLQDTPPSPRWMSRVRGGKIIVSPDHEDFPALLAEALDVTFSHAGDVAASAAQLKCTNTQLVKFFGKEPRALQLLNRLRGDHGLRELHSS